MGHNSYIKQVEDNELMIDYIHIKIETLNYLITKTLNQQPTIQQMTLETCFSNTKL